MGSQTLALFFRALRVDVRLLHSHIMRVALLVFVMLTMLSAQAMSVVMGAPGLIFFSQITFINLAFASLACPLLFATCITEEKEEQTLGLLRMANVRPITILTGKLAPRLASALLILVVQFPFTLLAITLGGVTSLQVSAAFWGLLAHTFLLGNIGMFCSVVARRSGTAVGLSVLLVFGHFVVPAIGYGYFSSTSPPAGAATSTDSTVQWLIWLHETGLKVFDAWYHSTASVLLSNVMTTGFGGSVLSQQVISNFAAGVVIFVLTWLLFDVCNRDVDSTAISATRTLSDLFRRKGRRSLRAWSPAAAITGREFQFASGGYGSWIIKLLAYGPAAYGALVLAEGDYRRVSSEDFGGMLLIVMLFVVLPLETIVLASRVFRREIKEKTWSSLLMLPDALAGISYRKIAGAALALAPTLFYFVLGAVLKPQGIVDFLRELDEPGVWVAIVLYVANFVLLLHLVTWFSILTNSWVGILLAVVSLFASIWIWQICIMLPVFFGGLRGGMDQNFVYVMYSFVACVLFVVSGVLHWHIGVRMRHAAAA